jgi:hypothetical protein
LIIPLKIAFSQISLFSTSEAFSNKRSENSFSTLKIPPYLEVLLDKRISIWWKLQYLQIGPALWIEMIRNKGYIC